MAVNVALLQLNSDASEPAAERVPRALELTRLATAGADLVVLPEMWVAGAFDVYGSKDLAQGLSGPLVNSFRGLAADTNTWLHMGSFAEIADHKLYNTSVLIAPTGEIAGLYRKRHLFGIGGPEAELLTAGHEFVVVDSPLGSTGLATCYDLRFPEQFRSLVDLHATAFVIASGWPESRITHWQVLLRARAIENQSWVLACNGVGQQCGVELGGRSAIIDPLGNVVAEAGSGEEVLRASIDPALADTCRAEFPCLQDR